VDLLLSHSNVTKHIPINYTWVKGHVDKEPWESIVDLRHQRFSRDEIYNIWVDRMANQEWLNRSLSDVSPEVTPAEKWAVYALHPEYHKLVGNLSTCLTNVLGCETTADYILQKHGLSQAQLKHMNTAALESFLCQLKISERANTVKLIHGWIPTMASLS
jgi:hypothetical protein